MGRMLHVLISVTTLVLSVSCDIVLQERGFLKLPDRNNNYTFDSGTAKESAFDQDRKILYVAGKDTQMLHVLNLNDVDNIQVLLNHKYDPAVEGAPLDVEVCISGQTATVAVSFESPLNPQSQGHVILYEPVTVGSSVLVPKNPSDPQITVGPHPDNIKFTSDCQILAVSNEGIPGMVEGNFIDPPGSISVIKLFTPQNPAVSTIEFTEVDNPTERDRLLKLGVRWFLRVNPISGLMNPFSNNIEPEYITISPNNGYVYVTLQENNAIARINLEHNFVSGIYPMGVKEWIFTTTDGSDRDSGIIMKKHNVSSFYQPDKIAFFEWKSKLYLVTADEGKPVSYPSALFTDYDRASSLHAKNEFQVFEPELDAELSDDSKLGRLFVSQYHDGREHGNIRRVYTFGGRGFSVFNAQTMVREWESGDHIEKYSRIFYPNVFNGDISDKGVTPFQERDKLSPITGPSLNAIADGEFNGMKMIILAGGKTGLIYIYQVVNSIPTRTDFTFQSVHRRGLYSDTWERLYSAGTIGDAGIEDLTFIPLDKSPVAGTPVLIVVASKSGSVSAYTFKEEQFPKGTNGDGSVCQP